MLLCLEILSRPLTGRTLHTVFVGDCTVAMISPAQYAAMNLEPDSRLASFARPSGRGSSFTRTRGSRLTWRTTRGWGASRASISGRTPTGKPRRGYSRGAEANCIIFPGLDPCALPRGNPGGAPTVDAGGKAAFPGFHFPFSSWIPRSPRGRCSSSTRRSAAPRKRLEGGGAVARLRRVGSGCRGCGLRELLDPLSRVPVEIPAVVAQDRGDPVRKKVLQGRQCCRACQGCPWGWVPRALRSPRAGHPPR